MKRVLAVFLCVCMLLSMGAYAVNEAHAAGLSNFTKANEYSAGEFSDVAESAWYYDSVKGAYELGLVKGVSESKFNPSGSMTVAEAIALACRIHSIYNTGKAEFVQGAPWYQVYLDYAVQNKIIDSVTDGGNVKFSAWSVGATDKIYRSAFAYIFSKTLPEHEFEPINEIDRVPDVGIGTAFETPVLLLYRAGVLTGSDEYGMFNPASHINRAEVATIATRIVDKSKRKTFTLKTIEKSEIICYPGTNVPDFGSLIRVAAYAQDDNQGIKQILYRATSILNSGHSEDFLQVYDAELLKNGYALTGVVTPGSDDENVFFAYGNGTDSVFVGGITDQNGDEYLMIIIGPDKLLYA